MSSRLTRAALVASALAGVLFALAFLVPFLAWAQALDLPAPPDPVSSAIGRAVDAGQWLAVGALVLYATLALVLPRLVQAFPALSTPLGKRATALVLGSLGTLCTSLVAGAPFTPGLVAASIAAALSAMGLADLKRNGLDAARAEVQS